MRTILEKSSGSIRVGNEKLALSSSTNRTPIGTFLVGSGFDRCRSWKISYVESSALYINTICKQIWGKQLQCKCVICCKLCADKNISHMPIRKYRYIDGFSFIFWTFYHLPIRITCMFPLNSCYAPIHTGPSQPSTQFCLFEHKWMKIKHTLSNSSIANTIYKTVKSTR